MLRIGGACDAVRHYYGRGRLKLYRGHFDAAKSMVSKPGERAEAYGNDVGYFHKYLPNIDLQERCQ